MPCCFVLPSAPAAGRQCQQRRSQPAARLIKQFGACQHHCWAPKALLCRGQQPAHPRLREVQRALQPPRAEVSTPAAGKGFQITRRNHFPAQQQEPLPATNPHTAQNPPPRASRRLPEASTKVPLAWASPGLGGAAPAALPGSCRAGQQEAAEQSSGTAQGTGWQCHQHLEEAPRRGGHKQGQEPSSSWQLVFVLAIPAPLRPGSSQPVQELSSCQGKLYLTCALPDCLHSSAASPGPPLPFPGQPAPPERRAANSST